MSIVRYSRMNLKGLYLCQCSNKGNNMNDDQKKIFREQALIPDGVSLELDKFDEFYEKRKVILTSKLRALRG